MVLGVSVVALLLYRKSKSSNGKMMMMKEAQEMVCASELYIPLGRVTCP